ncbi:MAG TPA: sigma-70 family RNA polymerase sigma factor [Nocardioidaceae bacterium]|nr:sigma-70 family RNA polymerase sigma factor [Nocardioidaceae bacterium]
MDEHDWLAEQFETHRSHLRSVAYRMLGSSHEADDAVQEAWIRLDRAGADDVENLRGWLTTVVGRICLDMLRSRRTRREDPLDLAEQVNGRDGGVDPVEDALLGESVSLALLVVLDSLSPAERVAFVMHDVFALPFDEIAPIVHRSPSATRMLASRARRRVRGRSTASDADLSGRREVLDAFLAASRDGDFEGLIAVLDPDVEIHADTAAYVPPGARAHVRGAQQVASQALMFSEASRSAQLVLVDGVPGFVVAPRGRRTVLAFQIENDRITRIDVHAEPSRLRELDIEIVAD